jgi:hypothetical protein
MAKEDLMTVNSSRNFSFLVFFQSQLDIIFELFSLLSLISLIFCSHVFFVICFVLSVLRGAFGNILQVSQFSLRRPP